MEKREKPYLESRDVMGENEQWYSNKELFEKIEGLNQALSDFKIEILETKNLIRSYNGLRELQQECLKKIDDLEKDVDTIKAEKVTKKESRDYAGWILALILGVISILQYVKVMI